MLNAAVPAEVAQSAGFAALQREAGVLLAVSGGPDSMALLHMVDYWRRAEASAPPIEVATVDHGLRPDAAEEVRLVGQRCRELGLIHHVLRLPEAPLRAIQEQARLGRYRRLALRARQRGLSAIVTAHHADDQAETIRMRLNRGSGLVGLAGIRAIGVFDGLRIHRPLLSCRKQALMEIAAAAGTFALDPSNSDTRFDRVSVRQRLDEAATRRLLRIGARASALRRRREWAAAGHINTVWSISPHGFAVASIAVFRAAPMPAKLAALAQLIAAIGGGHYGPARDKVMQLVAGLDAGQRGMTLGGCVFCVRGGQLWIGREWGRSGITATAIAPGDAFIWDDRFAVAAAPDLGMPLRLGPLDRLRDPLSGLPAIIARGVPGLFDMAGNCLGLADQAHHQGVAIRFTGTARLAMLGV